MDKFQGETSRCPRAGCDFVCDRDVNASINILLKYLTEHVGVEVSNIAPPYFNRNPFF